MGVAQAISAVPGIDISDLQTRKHAISQKLLKAAENVGFFYVTGALLDIMADLLITAFLQRSVSQVMVSLRTI